MRRSWLSKGALRVEQHHHHLGELDRPQPVGDRQLLELPLHLRLLAHAGGVEDAERRAAPVRPRTAIASRVMPGLRPGQQPLVAEDGVDQRRLAGVRPADDRDLDRPPGRQRRALARLVDAVVELLGDLDHLGGVREAPPPPARARAAGRPCRCRARPRPPPARRARARRPRSAPASAARPSALLATRITRGARLRSSSARVRSTGVTPARASIMKRQTSAASTARSVSARIRPGRLSAVASSSPAVSTTVKRSAPEPPLALAQVARDPGLVVDQRQPPADQAVEQRRLADVGPADDGEGERHAGFPARA